MTTIILVELGIAVVAGIAFVVLYAWKSRWSATPIGRHMMAFAVVTTGEAATLLALGLGVRVPPWVFAVGFGALDLVVIHRLVLLLRAQHSQR